MPVLGGCSQVQQELQRLGWTGTRSLGLVTVSKLQQQRGRVHQVLGPSTGPCAWGLLPGAAAAAAAAGMGSPCTGTEHRPRSNFTVLRACQLQQQELQQGRQQEQRWQRLQRSVAFAGVLRQTLAWLVSCQRSAEWAGELLIFGCCAAGAAAEHGTLGRSAAR